ncbi:MAG: rhodanese-like domain-containing protein [Rhodobacteraceae bacterium]|nr:MAG: rhodanese-like domain-containing protein [Paracoccaceae bacterium]
MVDFLRTALGAVALIFGGGAAQAADPLSAHEGRMIVDIRTPGEWRQTGVVDGAVLLTFFDERGRYDAAAFVASLDSALAGRDSREVTLICRTGSRTGQVKGYLQGLGYDVDHVEGGIMRALRAGVRTAPPAL